MRDHVHARGVDAQLVRQAPAAVHLYPSGDPGGLAAQLNALLATAETLAGAKVAALAAAQHSFCWERQERVLVDAVGCALDDAPREPQSSPALRVAGRPA